MGMVKARSIALAGAIVAGVLSEAAFCRPALADSYAFGSTSSNAILSVLEDGTWVFLTTLGLQGWISPQQYGIGGQSGYNRNYTAGVYNGSDFNNYFGFNLAGTVCEVSNTSDCFKLPATATVTAATLTVYSGKVTDNLQYNLFGATQWLTDMQKGSPNAALYQSMVSGVSYGSFALAKNMTNPMSQLIFTLNSYAVTDINAAIKNQANHKFGIAGSVEEPVPETSTWIMMLGGFAGLGVVARRRAARRRAAALAG